MGIGSWPLDLNKASQSSGWRRIIQAKNSHFGYSMNGIFLQDYIQQNYQLAD